MYFIELARKTVLLQRSWDASTEQLTKETHLPKVVISVNVVKMDKSAVKEKHSAIKILLRLNRVVKLPEDSIRDYVMGLILISSAHSRSFVFVRAVLIIPAEKTTVA